MLLSDGDIRAFQDIYKEQFGKEISKEDAYEKGVKLLRLLTMVYRPMKQEEMDFINQRRGVSASDKELHEYAREDIA